MRYISFRFLVFFSSFQGARRISGVCERGKKLNKYFQGWSWGVCPCEGLFVCAKGAKFFHVHQWAQKAQIFVLCVRKRRKSFLCIDERKKHKFYGFRVRKWREEFFRCIFFKFPWGFVLVILILLGGGGVPLMSLPKSKGGCHSF